MTSNHKTDNACVNLKVDDADLNNLQSMSDRELAAIDRRLKINVSKIRDEKARRRR